MTNPPTSNYTTGQGFPGPRLRAALRRIWRSAASPREALHAHAWAAFGDAGLSRQCTRCGDLLFPGPTGTQGPDSR